MPSKKPHIVFSVTNDLNHDQRMQRICNALHEAGYQITLIGFVKKKSVKLSNQPYHQKRFYLKFLKGKFFYLEYNLRLYFHFLRNDYDIYSAIDLDTVLAHYLASSQKKKTLVLDAHELYLGLPEIQDRPFTKRIWTFLEKWIYPKVKYAYTVNQIIADYYKSEYEVDFEVIRNCPVEAERSEKRDHFQPFILYQGALNEGRGIEQLIEAMQWIDMDLKIAGTGEIEKDLKALPSKFGVAHKVQFLGYLLPDKLKQVSEKAFIGANLLSAKSLNYYFSLANKFFDYMHNEIPQISMNYPEYRLINSEFEIAVLIDSLAPTKIADAINNLIEEKGKYQRLQENCIAAKKVYNWNNEKSKLLKFYDSIVE